jgi:hypothetical protein
MPIDTQRMRNILMSGIEELDTIRSNHEDTKSMTASLASGLQFQIGYTDPSSPDYWDCKSYVYMRRETAHEKIELLPAQNRMKDIITQIYRDLQDELDKIPSISHPSLSLGLAIYGAIGKSRVSLYIDHMKIGRNRLKIDTALSKLKQAVDPLEEIHTGEPNVKWYVGETYIYAPSAEMAVLKKLLLSERSADIVNHPFFTLPKVSRVVEEGEMRPKLAELAEKISTPA